MQAVRSFFLPQFDDLGAAFGSHPTEEGGGWPRCVGERLGQLGHPLRGARFLLSNRSRLRPSLRNGQWLVLVIRYLSNPIGWAHRKRDMASHDHDATRSPSPLTATL